MSATPSEKTPSSKQTKQIVLVAILSIGLLIAMLTQPSDESSELSESSDLAATLATVATISPATATPILRTTTAIANFSQTRTLPRTELNQIRKTPLFRSDLKSPSTIAASEAVRAVYGSALGHRALVDREILTDGQSLSDGRTIVRVTSDGIQLSKNVP
ncbi:hypothetical protein Poly51_01700 [Rubripirellula tenax]|uniref:Uncharacterized protein n=1 Tax=Rubripirellula tenax TaxID=2528015 RepID=A0A5C6FIJ8_9BACT|nr:hypothetical protein [Rubripirellula tenax]TWU59897.1 hypothetical protein Poly51_01700 [Rubripirellula tenax]